MPNLVRLKERQEAAAEVEKAMLEFLMQFEPSQRLTVGDVKMIAGRAGTVSFNSFSEVFFLPEEQ